MAVPGQQQPLPFYHGPLSDSPALCLLFLLVYFQHPVLLSNLAFSFQIVMLQKCLSRPPREEPPPQNSQ